MIASISNFLLKFTLTNPAFESNPTIQQIQQMLSFGNLSALQTKEGTYTPNNDYEWLWQNIPANEAPTFIFIQTPTSLNLTINTPGGNAVVKSIPINKVFMLCVPAGYVVDNIYIEGRPSESVLAMAQGVPCQYFCLMARASF